MTPIITPSLLHSQMGIDGRIASSSSQVLVLAIRNMKMGKKGNGNSARKKGGGTTVAMEGNSSERLRPNDVGMVATIRFALGLVTKKHAMDGCHSPGARGTRKNGGDGH